MKTVELNPVTSLVATPAEARPALSLSQKLLLVLGASASFHLAFASPLLVGFILLYAACLIQLGAKSSPRGAFRNGFLAGFLVFAPHLAWFWSIFGPTAICLWAILSFFTGLFVLTLSLGNRFGPKWLLVAGVVWTGVEFFRGELYYLRFSWLSAGHVFSAQGGLIPVSTFGIYGLGFLVFTLAGICLNLRRKAQLPAIILSGLCISLLADIPAPHRDDESGGNVHVAGIQLEFPASLEVPGYLDQVIARHPEAQILVLSEYTFDAGIPPRVREWCRQNKRYLIAGGKDDSLGGGAFYNTAFVVGPDGNIVFQQAKSVPIQFFRDGSPAPERKVWDSPWGKLAIPICYDLSYRRVMDDFMGQGAQGIIVPFMDVADWGGYQHRLHARVAPLRAQEYQVPIFRLGSSGISQNVTAQGRVLAAGNFPGQEEIVSGTLQLAQKPNLPLDRWLAPGCSVAAGLLLVGVLAAGKRKRFA